MVLPLIYLERTILQLYQPFITLFNKKIPVGALASTSSGLYGGNFHVKLTAFVKERLTEKAYPKPYSTS